MCSRVLLLISILLGSSDAFAFGFADPDMSKARVRTHYADPATGTPSQPIHYNDPCFFSGQGIPVVDSHCPTSSSPTVFGDTSLFWQQGALSEPTFWLLELNIEPFQARCSDGQPVNTGPPHLSAPVHALGDGGLFEFAMDARLPGESFNRAYLSLDIAKLDDAVRCPITPQNTSRYLVPFIGIGANEHEGNGGPLGWIAPPGDPMLLPDSLEFTARIWDFTPPTHGALHFSLWITSEWGGVSRMLFVNLFNHMLPWHGLTPPIWGEREWDWPIAESYLSPGADLAFLDTERLLSWCGLDVPPLDPSEGDRTYHFDLRALFACASQNGQFLDPLPNGPTRITGVHWAVEASSNLSGGTNDGAMKASIHGTRICFSGIDCNEADLSIYAADTTNQYEPGQNLTYTVAAVHQAGADKLVVNARVRGMLPSDVDVAASSWTCQGQWGAICGDSSGQGAIDEAITLPPGGAVFFTISATATGTANDDPLLFTASVEAISDQAGRPVVDPDPTNDIAQDANRLTRRPLYRLFLKTPGTLRGYDHLLTSDKVERDQLVADGWLNEGIHGYVYPSNRANSIPLHRLVISIPNPEIRDHFYTTFDSQKNAAISMGYVDEGAVGWVSPTVTAETKLLYRLYAPHLVDHFYTTSPLERDAAISSGFNSEGGAGWVWSSP